MEKVKVMHRRARSEKISTRFGEFVVDENGTFEVDKDTAKVMCDIAVYNGIFSYAPKVKEAPKPKDPDVTKPDLDLSEAIAKMDAAEERKKLSPGAKKTGKRSKKS